MLKEYRDHGRSAPRRLRAALAGVSVLGLLAAAPVAAQNHPQVDALREAPVSGSGTAADPVGRPAADGDIIVTARKRDERLRDVPVAVAVVGGEELQRKNVIQLIDLTAIVPSLHISSGTTQPLTYVRGFGSGSNTGFEQSVGKFVDNVYLGRDQDGRLPLFDIERVEVLKGPQVIAFGNSSTVGALNITTRKPGSSLEADGSISYEFEARETILQGGINLPITSAVQFRVAGLFQDLNKGQTYNRLLDEHEPMARTWAVRPTLRIQPSAELQVLLRYEYDHVRRNGSTIQAIAQPLRPGALPYPEVDDPDELSVDPSRPPISSRDVTGIDHHLVMADVRYDIGGGQLISTTAYRKENAIVQLTAQGPANVNSYFQSGIQDYDQFSQELRFAGTYGPLDISVGGYFERNELNVIQLQYFFLGAFGTTGPAATPIGRVAYFDQKTKKYSGFADFTYRVTNQFSITAGLRYSRSEKRAGQSVFGITPAPGVNFDTDRAYIERFRSAGIDALIGPVLGSPPHVIPFNALKLAEDFWQPQVISQYKFDDTMIYAKYVRGEKAGGFDYLYAGSDPTGATFRPERAESLEAGIKGLIAERRLDYALTVFRTTYTALQQSVFRDTTFVISNVGKARSQGVEAEFTYRPVSGLRIGVSGNYLDAKFIDFPGAACSSVQNLTTPRGCLQDLSNTPQQFASKWSGTLSADYETPVSNGYVVGGGASVYARSKFNAGATNDPRAVQEGFAQLDAHLDLKSGNGRWALSLFARNLTDKQYLEFAILPPGQNTASLGTYSRGRQVGLRFSANYR